MIRNCIRLRRLYMYLWQIKNLLPKRLNEGVALNRLVSNITLQRLRGFKKQFKYLHFSRLSKVSLGTFVLLFLAGYQPAATFPPIKRSLVLAEEASYRQAIEGAKLSQPFILPHPGYLTTTFSSWHPGIDIATGLGMPVKPIAPGKVIDITYGIFGLGHSVTIEHEQGFKSIYGHMGRIFVKKEDVVSSSTTIGEVGMTGRTTGPHTHLELTRNEQYINPQTILPPLSDWPATAGLGPQGEGARHISPSPTKTITPTPIKAKVLSISEPGYFTSELKTNKNKLSKLPPLLMSQQAQP